MSKVILIHYGEIGLKGKNRRFFEDRLIKNIQAVIRPVGSFYVRKTFGRLFIESVTEKDWPQLKARLQKIFGLANFVLAEKINISSHSDPRLLQKCGGRIPRVLGIIQKTLEQKFLSPLPETSSGQALTPSPNKLDEGLRSPLKKGGGIKSFRISARRAQKDFTLTSQELNEELGAFVQEKTSAKVDLKNPEIIFYVEVVNQDAFLYCDFDVETHSYASLQEGIIQGAGGLPVGVSGKAVCLISGGIDSPVAAWLMMKRGLAIYFVHFHSAPQTDTASQEKVRELVKILDQWQPCVGAIHACPEPGFGESPPRMIPFLAFQKKVLTKTPAKYRVILYRREMLRQAEKLAQQIGAKALITGDALGQVASQTIENLAVIEEAVSLPVLRPLIGFDKQEIINLAQKIGTYNISIEPHQDCCSLFIPKHPATKARLEDIRRAEELLEGR